MRDREWNVVDKSFCPKLRQKLSEMTNCFNVDLDECFTEVEMKSMSISRLRIEHLETIVNTLEVMLAYDDAIKPSRDKVILESIFDLLNRLNTATTEQRTSNYFNSLNKALENYENEIGTHRKWLRTGVEYAIKNKIVNDGFIHRLEKKIKEIKPKQRDQKFRAAIELVATRIYQIICPSPSKCEPMAREDIKKSGVWIIKVEDEKYVQGMAAFYGKLNQKRKNRFKVLFKSLCKELALVGKGKLFSTDDLLEKQLQNFFINKK